MNKRIAVIIGLQLCVGCVFCMGDGESNGRNNMEPWSLWGVFNRQSSGSDIGADEGQSQWGISWLLGYQEDSDDSEVLASIHIGEGESVERRNGSVLRNLAQELCCVRARSAATAMSCVARER